MLGTLTSRPVFEMSVPSISWHATPDLIKNMIEHASVFVWRKNVTCFVLYTPGSVNMDFASGLIIWSTVVGGTNVITGRADSEITVRTSGFEVGGPPLTPAAIRAPDGNSQQ